MSLPAHNPEQPLDSEAKSKSDGLIRDFHCEPYAIDVP